MGGWLLYSAPAHNSRTDTAIMLCKQRKHGTKDPLLANIGALQTHREQQAVDSEGHRWQDHKMQTSNACLEGLIIIE